VARVASELCAHDSSVVCSATRCEAAITMIVGVMTIDLFGHDRIVSESHVV